MSTRSKLAIVLVTTVLVLMLPYWGAVFHFSGVFPENYFAFPPLVAPEKPGFSLLVFIVIALIGVVIVSFYLFPKLFGFRTSDLPDRELGDDRRFPIWFWIGGITWLVTLLFLWLHFESPKWLLNWADIPLFWGFALMLDGIIYKRTGGQSILGKHPRELMAMGLASSIGWMIFEWLNFFVEDNWLYPEGDRLSDDQFLLYAFIGSTGLMAMSFEWYSLLNTFNGMRRRYANGPKIRFGRTLRRLIFVACGIGLFMTPFLPNYCFFLIWTAPLVMLTIALTEAKIWTPFDLISKGNWTPVLFLALTFFVQGLLCECWNYFSGVHTAGSDVTSLNPDYWVYTIPYVNVLHVFEMPMLGLGGYLPFGIYTGIWWIAFAFIFNIPTQFREEGHYNL